MKIEGIPDSITRDDYLRLIASTGLDINRIRALEFRTDGIYVAVKARYPSDSDIYIAGARDIFTSDGYDNNECATHRIFIPVVG